jgi:hypothetical protein
MNDNMENTNNCKNLLNFHEILQLFNCAVSQEQAWAILYQLLKEYKHLIEQNLIFLYNQLISNNQNNDIGIENVYFRKDGSVYISLAFRNTNFNDLSYIDLHGMLHY